MSRATHVFGTCAVVEDLAFALGIDARDALTGFQCRHVSARAAAVLHSALLEDLPALLLCHRCNVSAGRGSRAYGNLVAVDLHLQRSHIGNGLVAVRRQPFLESGGRGAVVFAVSHTHLFGEKNRLASLWVHTPPP